MTIYLVWLADEVGKELIEIYDSAEKAALKEKELHQEIREKNSAEWSFIQEFEVK